MKLSLANGVAAALVKSGHAASPPMTYSKFGDGEVRACCTSHHNNIVV
jgi:hypothetical protein